MRKISDSNRPNEKVTPDRQTDILNEWRDHVAEAKKAATPA